MKRPLRLSTHLLNEFREKLRMRPVEVLLEERPLTCIFVEIAAPNRTDSLL